VDLGLDGRAFVVTGGTRGLGLATAQQLVAEGARVVVSGRDEGGVAAAAEQLGGSDHALGLVADNADPDSAERLLAAAVGRYGRIDGALVSVGGPPAGSVLDTPDDVWRASFESVFLGAIRIARAVAGAVGADGGSVAFVLSSSVKQPIDGLAVSNGLRPGLAMVAKGLAAELGSQRVRVNGLLPGRIDTDRVRELDEAAGDAAEARRAAERGIPLGRYGTAEEFGRVAAFVLSPAAGYVTGAMIPVDGGSLRAL
jgi:3-oxoacyl-[acyl-carrier protein] reductase